MDTNKLKRFATEARTSLIKGVEQLMTAIGFNRDGSIGVEPEWHAGGGTFRGEIINRKFYDQWMSLRNAVNSYSRQEVIEEAAYTWFNRLMAIRIMVKNGLLAPALSYEGEASRIPVLVAEARQNRLPKIEDKALEEKIRELLKDDSKTPEQFRLLIVAYCHATPAINKCFGRLADYTELLLPGDILAEGRFIDMLNHTDFISDSDYESPELIGWLYQFYISDRKSSAMAKNERYEMEELGPVTQIFTPNWIVKYMVENTLGRIFLDNNPDAVDEFSDKWKYLVEPAQQTPEYEIDIIEDPENLRCADFACGSGHILNEMFDMLYDIFIYYGYSGKDAISNIFGRCLVGIDLDTRAKQLAMFALLLKACQKDASYADAHLLPMVLDMPKVRESTWRALGSEIMSEYGATTSSENNQQIADAFKLMEQADVLGSIMKFELSDSARSFVADLLNYIHTRSIDECGQFSELIKALQLLNVLTDHYDAIAMNPPYMGMGRMENGLKGYILLNYNDAKNDLCDVFMDVCSDRAKERSKWGMINMQSWAYHTTLTSFRERYLSSWQIDNLLHLGTNTFEELSGEVVQNVAFVISKAQPQWHGCYIDLTMGENFIQKENLFIHNDASKYYTSQLNFLEIPSSTCAYWISEKQFEIIAMNSPLSTFSDPRAGLQTSDNPRFLRLWHEISWDNLGIDLSREDALSSEYKWFPHNKGGETRRWYGNRDIVINFYHDGEELKYWLEHNPKDPTTKSWSRNLRSYPMYFKEGATWSGMSNFISVRFSPQGSTFDTSGPMLFAEDINYIIGLTNTKVFASFVKIFAQSLSKGSGAFGRVPFILSESLKDTIDIIVEECISISKSDWDAHETSWDFQENELIALNSTDAYMEVLNDYCDFNGVDIDAAAPQLGRLEWLLDIYKMKWETKFYHLHANEEELNRKFIEIYGLEDELTPDVPLKEVTILQQGEIKIVDEAALELEDGSVLETESGETLTVGITPQIEWQQYVIIKQFLSYAFGCLMGRYSIDRPGLVLANQGDDEDKYYELVPDSRFKIDQDGIIPLMPENTWFLDNATKRFKRWLGTALGEEFLNDNLNFIEKCIGKSIDDYFMKDFWKDHKKMYGNRPIYWLFSSKKEAFQCAAYLHRMTPYTAERIRTKYLLPHIEWLKARKEEMQANAANLSARERKELDSIGKQIEECREYHDRLHTIADLQIDFDLDDGVVKNYALFGDVLSKLK